ncbi:MAG TPA: potassium-transporting ATPase subunit KdpC [Burkholderiaceae bacterium]|nr:potassium-transporting ATPase subunit KdpC [Burkholderiaceae bacterium]
MQRDFMNAAIMLLLLTVVTGVVYPGVVTVVAQLAMHDRAQGSLILRDGKAVGSTLIGQPLSDPKYFWSRPSATSPQPYNGLASSGSNLGPTNPALTDAVKERIEALKAADPGNTAPVPQDLVTASASGLDPHISPAAAEYQLRRVARVRGVDENKLRGLVATYAEPRQFGVLGEARVNVLLLNLALDAMK